LHDPIAQKVDEAEEVIRRSSLEYTILRPTMIYGHPRDRNVSELVKVIKKVPIVPLPGGGKNLVQPVFLLDLVDAIVGVMRNDRTVRREYIIGGPEAITYRKMIHTIAAVLGKKRFILPLPVSTAYAVASVLERLHVRAYFSPEQVLRFGEDRAFDISEAVREIPYSPHSFEEGLKLGLKSSS
jgi:nucleoside-diphosphate-sugar epimerase